MPEVIEKEELKPIPWESTEKKRAPWKRDGVNYGEFVLPQCEQKSNLPLTAKDTVMPRDEKIGGSSQATPLTRSNRQSDEPSGTPRTYPDSGGISL